MVNDKHSTQVYRRATALGRKPTGVSPGPRMKKEPDCEIARECGACAFINRPYREGLRSKFDAGLKILRESSVLGESVVVPAVEAPNELGCRAFAKLAVRECPAQEKGRRRVVAPHRPRYRVRTDEDPSGTGANGPQGEMMSPDRRFSIGLFKPKTHDVVSLLRCPLHSHVIRRLLHALQTALDGSTLTPYNERTGDGDIRYVAIRAAHLTEEIMITFVVTSPRKAELRKIVNELRGKDHNITSAHMNIHPGNSNAIFGDRTELVAGTERLREKMCEIELEISPTAFFQVNPWQAENIYRRIEIIAGDCPDKKTPAWDLYCGAGIISLILARAGYRVFGIEENPQAIVDAQRNAELNRLETRTTFAAGLVETMITETPVWAKQPQLIVVNPSRRGMADSVRARLAGHMTQNPETRLVYMSCEVETLARDLKDILAAGFRLRQIEAFDMFPQTDNIEWLAVVTK